MGVVTAGLAGEEEGCGGSVFVGLGVGVEAVEGAGEGEGEGEGEGLAFTAPGSREGVMI